MRLRMDNISPPDERRCGAISANEPISDFVVYVGSTSGDKGPKYADWIATSLLENSETTSGSSKGLPSTVYVSSGRLNLLPA